jgi:hypothetical protein
MGTLKKGKLKKKNSHIILSKPWTFSSNTDLDEEKCAA